MAASGEHKKLSDKSGEGLMAAHDEPVIAGVVNGDVELGGPSAGMRSFSAGAVTGKEAKAVKSDVLLREALLSEPKKVPPSKCQKVQGAILPVVVLVIIIGLVVMLFIINSSPSLHGQSINPFDYICQDPCSLSIAESIPVGMAFSDGPSHNSTYASWMRLLGSAKATIDIASFYWTLRSKDVFNDSSSWEGESVFAAVAKAGVSGNIKVRIVQDVTQDSADVDYLSSIGAAEVRKVNMTALLGSGVLHTKFIVVDSKHLYVGSANMDWRSLTQVKELGAVLTDCSCMATDLLKIFSIYWRIGAPGASIPPAWPANYDTLFNSSFPLNVTFEGMNTTSSVYFSSSPPPFSTPSRADDAKTIVNTIDGALSSVCIAVMDYSPTSLYMPGGKNIFWPVIDDAIRRASFERRASIRLLISLWPNHTHPVALDYLASLAAFSRKISVKLFLVPSNGSQAQIPFARVNHNKYMVTDNVAYIGTSNWAADYFITTAGVGLVVNETAIGRSAASGGTLRAQLQAVFDRDWSSSYTVNLTEAQRILS